MYVKQITISGFKSYRDDVVAGPFSEGHNVVVGRNGSGKSNFFDAVRFVLSDTFANLRAEDRIALLNEGAGVSVLSAYVEIVFDNSDGRLPYEKDDVALRRMIGLKKDEYVLERKNVSRSEVFNLLESAGFSRSNPYYIVQQGKVASLVSMTDPQRLDLLREVAGTRVYDERRAESLKLMEETDGKREKINEVVLYIEERLAELESEKEELKEFQVLDKERRAIEYTIHVKDLEDAKAKLDELEVTRAEEHDRNLELYHLQRENEMKMKAAEQEQVSLENSLRRLREELQRVETQHGRALESAARLRVDVLEAQDAARSGRGIRQDAESVLLQVRQSIKEKNAQLELLMPAFQELKRQEEESLVNLSRAEKRILDLRVKAERNSQFRTKRERDAHLRQRISAGQSLLEESRKQQADIRAEEEQLAADTKSLKAVVNTREEEVEEKRLLLETSGGEITLLKKERDALQASRQELWREDATLDASIKSLTSDLHQQERVLRGGIGSSSYLAIKTVNEACKENAELSNGYYGPVYDIISVGERFATAVDTAAGGALTYVVVDTDDTAAKLVKILQREKAGRITFIPLNRLEEQRSAPMPASQDAIPLISKVQCDEELKPALRQIFGSTMIARSVAVASQLAKQSNVDCVTLDGDLVNRRGAMTGGFVDVRRSRVEAATNLRKLRTQIKEQKNELKLAREKIQKADVDLANVLAQIESKLSARKTTQGDILRLRTENENAETSMSNSQKSLETIRGRLSSIAETVEETEAELSSMEQEILMPLSSTLSDDEKEELDSLVNSLPALQEALSLASRERSTFQVDVDKLVEELDSNLKKREAELERTIKLSMTMRDDPGVDAAAALGAREDELEAAQNEAQSYQVAVEKSEKEVKGSEASAKQLAISIDEFKSQDSRIAKDIAEQQERMETLFNRRAMLLLKKDDIERKVRELGSLPNDFEKFQGSSPDALMRQLKTTNGKLKSYSHVNKKALDQYMNFTEQRDTLQNRRKELDDGADAIHQLIDSLDTRKDEDIMRTFKGVSKHFAEVFKELVPGGKASLILHRGGEESGKISYSGVSMKVSFSGSGDSYMLNQLSGGQKSIVALSLIFAIQRLDPAPFYLFDEIDANLDASHRQSVAELIKKQTKTKTQFITTTFRAEFVNTGDKLFGVTHRNKISAINEIRREEALDFITEVPPT
eukprot:CAMPEP_0113958638 /NCGR_PEP_ID=MMETSP0011_2-20120614/3580_1 /TAXON_ID=101924 /ORGANISM="Rhodosorus marinus" /LENGTH=1190 /DNA_ID=CAMNT_0000969621 /DNA_START=394 /DNA_END=3966 /DNA_ORIENTATION=- /assembly_acc=CAM_ASM_000156